MMQEIIDLIQNCGFILRFENKAERKARFDNANTFIDVWYGKKKKIVVGIFDPMLKRMKYERPYDIAALEELIIKI